MRYEIRDTHGDPIVVLPLEPEGIIPRAVIRFTTVDQETDEPYFIDMVLTDRMVTDLKQALNRSIRESMRTG